MNHLKLASNNRKIVNILSWTLILGSVLMLFKLHFFNNGYVGKINEYLITKNFDPPVDYHFTSFFIFGAIETILCIAILISAVFVKKHEENWRKFLIYILAASIIVSFISPKLIFYPYLWSAILSVLLISIIVLLSKKEIKSLFK